MTRRFVTLSEFREVLEAIHGARNDGRETCGDAIFCSDINDAIATIDKIEQEQTQGKGGGTVGADASGGRSPGGCVKGTELSTDRTCSEPPPRPTPAAPDELATAVEALRRQFASAHGNERIDTVAWYWLTPLVHSIRDLIAAYDAYQRERGGGAGKGQT